MRSLRVLLLCVSTISTIVGALQQQQQKSFNNNALSPQRRALFTQVVVQTATLAAATLTIPVAAANAVVSNGIALTESPSGLKWADPKVGTGQAPKSGSPVSIDYSMASTAGRFPKIYTTKDTGSPYRWTLGDGSTIQGIEMAILGSGDGSIPPMQPGGIRRVIIPEALGYQSLANPANAKQCIAGGSIGPIPPKDSVDGAYQRWYQFYCNPRIPYQPDLVLDIKLYGKR